MRLTGTGRWRKSTGLGSSTRLGSRRWPAGTCSGPLRMLVPVATAPTDVDDRAGETVLVIVDRY